MQEHSGQAITTRLLLWDTLKAKHPDCKPREKLQKPPERKYDLEGNSTGPAQATAQTGRQRARQWHLQKQWKKNNQKVTWPWILKRLFTISKNRMVYHWLVITKGTPPKAWRGGKQSQMMECKKELVFFKHMLICGPMDCINPTNSWVEVLIPGVTVCGGRK